MFLSVVVAMSAPSSKVFAGGRALAGALGGTGVTPCAGGEDKLIFAAVAFAENVTFTGGYLKQPAVVAVHRQGGQMFVLIDHSDWVCKAVCGCSRARNPLKSEKSLIIIREHAAKVLQESSASSALAEDPMLALEGEVSLSVGDLTPVKRLRRTVQSGVLVLPACELAPPGLVVLFRFPCRCMYSRADTHVQLSMFWTRMCITC